MTTCMHCGATTSNGLMLCELCQRFASECFTQLPVYFRNLTRWRPGRAGSRQVPGSRVLYDGEQHDGRTGDRISDRLDEALTSLITWARALIAVRGIGPRPLTLADAMLSGDLPDEIADDPPTVVAGMCAAFDQHLNLVATLPTAGDLVRDLSHHEARLRAFTETLVPGWYAGACRRRITMESTCGAPTYVVPGLSWVKCGACGATTHAADHLEAVIDEAREWVSRPMRLAEAAVALIDTELSVPRLHKRISKWGERGRIRVIREHEYAPKRFQFGDVLDALFSEGATPITDTNDARVS